MLECSHCRLGHVKAEDIPCLCPSCGVELTKIITMRRPQWLQDIYDEEDRKFLVELEKAIMPFKTTPEDIKHMFTYHPPKPEQIPKYEELREAAETFAQTILRLTPGCADQTAAIRKVREAVMTANAAIALEK